MAVVDVSKLGSYFENTPKGSLSFSPPAGNGESSAFIASELLNRSGFASIDPVNILANQLAAAKGSGALNLTQNTASTSPEVLDLTSKSNQTQSGGTNSASPSSSTQCLQCRQDLEIGQNLCLACQMKNSQAFFAAITNLTAVAPQGVPNGPLNLATMIAAQSLIPGAFSPKIQPSHQKQPPSPSSSCSSGNNYNSEKSPNSPFFCEKCNISFRTANSLEAHRVDYCQRSGQITGPRRPQANGRRRPAESSSTPDLICQLCGYRGHSERGIRVHFNAMHSIGSEIQLEQYLTTMITRNEPSSQVETPSLSDISTPPSKSRRQSVAKKEQPMSHLLVPTLESFLASSPAMMSPSPVSTLQSWNSTLRRQPPFDCKLCSKSFPDTAKLRLHMRSHEKDESITYSCKRCNNFTTTVKMDLVRHVKAEHEGGGNVRLASWALKTSDSPNSLEAQSTSSEGDGPMYCNVCQIRFNFRHSYDAHRQYYCMAKWNNMDKTESIKLEEQVADGAEPIKVEEQVVEEEDDEETDIDVTS